MTAKRLLIYLSSYPAPYANWVAWDEAGVVQAIVSEGNIADLQAYAQGYDITVIIPGEDCLLSSATLPKLNRQRLLQALPYALEEQLIDDVQNLHFAVGEYQADGTVPVVIIKRQLIETYVAMLKQVGIEANAMIPATLALPFIPHQWQIYVLKDICLIRTGKHQGFACDHENIATFLTLQCATSAEQPESLQIYYFSNLTTALQIPHVVTQEISCAEKNVLISMSDSIPNASINLLQGQYASKQTSSLTKKIWRASGYIAASWIALLFLSNIVSYYILQHAVQKTELAINTIYKKHFPAATSVVAPRERMQEKLKKFSSDANKNYMLSLLGMIGNSLHQSPVIHVKQFDFREHSLTLTIVAPSFDALDRFSQSLKQQGLQVKQQSAGAGTKDAEVKASLIINKGVA
jgi:general secretion pathway protein L